MRVLLLSLDTRMQHAMLNSGRAPSRPASVTEALKLFYTHDGTLLDPGLQELNDGKMMAFSVVDETAGGRGSSDELFNNFIKEEAERKDIIEERLRERLLVSAETVSGEKRFVKVGVGSTGFGFGLRVSPDDKRLEICKVNDGSAFSYEELKSLLAKEVPQRPAFVALVRKSFALKFEWRHIIHDVVTGEITPNIMSAYRVAGGDTTNVSQQTRGMSGSSDFSLFSSSSKAGDIRVRIGTQHRVFRVRDFKHLICLLTLFGGFWGAVFDLHPQTGSATCSVDINRFCKPVVHGSEAGTESAAAGDDGVAGTKNGPSMSKRGKSDCCPDTTKDFGPSPCMAASRTVRRAGERRVLLTPLMPPHTALSHLRFPTRAY
jgi:hypothetical protein